MLNVQFKLLESRKDKDGKCPVYLVSYYEGRQLMFSTKERCESKYWDSERMRFRKSMLGSQEANEYLESLMDRLRGAYRDYMSKGIIPTPFMLKAELLPSSTENKETIKRIELLETFEKFIHYQALNDKKYNTVRAYKTGVVLKWRTLYSAS